MPSYQVRMFSAEGRRHRETTMECDTDEDAIERLLSLHHRHALELWCGERLVERIAGTVGR